MKMAVVIPTLTLGGAEKIALETAIGFSDAGHDVTLILFSDKIILKVPDGIVVRKGINNIFLLMKVFRDLQIVQCISYMERANFICALACKLLKIKHCATVHTAPKAGFQLRSKKNRLAISLTYRILRILNTKIIGVCNGIVSDLENLYGIKNHFVIPNFIDVDATIKLASENDTEENYDFIFVGRLSKVKGCHILVDALGTIRDYCEQNHIRVAIIGDGPEKCDLIKRITEYRLQNIVKMCGAKNNPYPYIKNSTYIIIPSYAEGFGMVVLEGLALGTKTIYSRCDFGPSEIINENFKELQFLAFEDPSVDSKKAIDELASIIKNIGNNKMEFNAASVRERVITYYNKKKICGQFLEILDR